MNKSEKKAPTSDRRLFFTGVLFLGGANVLVKVIGLLFKIPMSYYLGDVGMGYFNSAYQIYTWLYMLANSGLPVALSIAVARARAREDGAAVRRVFSLSLLLFLSLGALFASLMLLFARPLAAFVGAGEAYYGIAAMAPAMFFVCLSSAMRGYLQGFSKMGPSAVSQVLEALGKLLIGVYLASYAAGHGYTLPQVAAFAVAGLSVGEAAGTVYLVFACCRHRRTLAAAPAGTVKKERAWPVLCGLLRTAAPITLSSLVMSVTGMIDLVMVQNRLQAIGFTPSSATAFYGNYTTLVVPMFNLPPALIYPIATAAVPLLTAALSAGRQEAARARMASIMRLAALIAMPCALGMAIFSRPILSLFFPVAMAESAAPLLSVLSIGSLFLSLLSVSQAILQAGGLGTRPVISMLVGGAFKLLGGYFLIGVPAVGVLGVPLGTVLCYLAAMLCNLFALAGKLSFVPSLSYTFFRPFAASVLSLGIALGFYLLFGGDAGHPLLFLPTAAIAVVCYLAAVLLSGTLMAEDVAMLPGGERWLRLLPGRKISNS